VADAGFPGPRPLPVRLIPAEPWWLANTPPQLLEALVEGAAGAAEALGEALRAWLRGRRCSVCGAEARMAAGYWVFVVDEARAEASAELEGLVPLCSLCRYAYWPGEAVARGVYRDVVRRMEALRPGYRREAEEALALERRLNTVVESWRPRLAERLHEALGGHGLGYAEASTLEAAAALLASPPFAADWDTVTVSYPQPRPESGECIEAAQRWSSAPGVDRAALGKAAEAARAALASGEGDWVLEGYWEVPLSSHREAGEALAEAAAHGLPEQVLRVEVPLRGPPRLRLWTSCVLDAAGALAALEWLSRVLGRPVAAGYRHGLSGLTVYRVPALG